MATTGKTTERSVRSTAAKAGVRNRAVPAASARAAEETAETGAGKRAAKGASARTKGTSAGKAGGTKTKPAGEKGAARRAGTTAGGKRAAATPPPAPAAKAGSRAKSAVRADSPVPAKGRPASKRASGAAGPGPAAGRAKPSTSNRSKADPAVGGGRASGAVESRPASAKAAGRRDGAEARGKARAEAARLSKPARKAASPRRKAKAPKEVSEAPAALPPDLPEGYVPNGDEEYMGPLQAEYFRRKLIGWRQALVDESEQTLESMRDQQREVGDEAERASRETEMSFELRTRDRYRKLIRKIDEALARIEDGTYGFCEETGDPIGLGRLEARPIATLSVEAQERREMIERQYRP